VSASCPFEEKMFSEEKMTKHLVMVLSVPFALTKHLGKHVDLISIELLFGIRLFA
jgi:hypothetical protein